MPKKKANKSKKPISFMQKVVGSIKSFYDTRTWTKIFLTLLVFWGLVWCGQVAVERYSFYRAEKAMDSITQDLHSNFNVISAEKNRSCGKRSHAFGESLGGCSISYEYEVASSKENLDAAKKIDSMIQSQDSVKIYNSNSYIQGGSVFVKIPKIGDDDPEKFSSSYKLNGANSLDCSVSYSFKEQSESLSVYFSCYISGRDARFQYFPIGD